MKIVQAVLRAQNRCEMTWSIQRKMIAGFALAFLVLMSVNGAVFIGIRGFDNANEWQNHTFNVISRLQNMVILLQEARGGQRGYLITGDFNYIGIYYRSAEQLETEVNELERLVRDNPSQYQKLTAIKPLVKKELALFKDIIDARYKSGINAAIDLVRNGQAKQLMDIIRSKIAVMKSEEVKLLNVRRSRAQDNANNAWIANIIGTSAIFLIMLTLFFITNKEMKDRLTSGLELEQRNKILEDALEGIAQLDEQGRFLAVNKSYASMLGYKPEELLELTFNGVTPAESREVVDLAYSTLLTQGRAEYEAYTQRKDGSLIASRIVTVSNLDQNGRFIGYFCFMKDISEQRYLQDILKQSEERFRSIIDSVKDYSIISLDVEGQVTSWNAGAEKIKGYTATEILGKHFSCFYPEEKIKHGEPSHALNQAKCNGHYEEESWRVRKDGSHLWANVIITALYNDKEELIGFSKITRDLTERKQAEDRFKVLFEYSSDAHLLFDETGIVDCNDAAVKLLGCGNKKDVLHMHPAELSPEFQPDGQRSMVKCLEMDVIAQENGYHRFEWIHKKVTGEEFPVEVSLTPVDISNKPAMLVVWHDLTDRKDFERKLVESEAQLRVTMDYAPIGMAIVSVEGRFLHVNKALCSIIGYSEEELLNLDFQRITHPEDVDSDLKLLVQTLTGEIESYSLEKRYIHKQGYPVWIQLNVFLLRDTVGTPVHFIAQIQDITERKSIQTQLVEAKEAALDAVQMKSNFLANMSHEIRTPMNGILGLTEIVMKSPLDENQHRHLSMVQSSAKSLLNIINDILDFSKIEAGKLSFDPIPFMLRESLEETLTPFSQLVQDKRLELLYRVAPDVPNQLIGDPSRVRQLITNLIGNALKFTQEGEVLLDIAVESLNTDTVCLHFKVSDTGIGLSPDKLSVIFDPFAQAEDSTTRRYGGTGLGLSICKQLAEVMQGNIWVDSELGKGSTFHFTARFSLSPATISSIIPAHIDELKEMPILLVDDNETNLHIMREALLYYQMSPTLASDAKSALKALNKAADEGHPFPIMIVDVVMPEMDGFELSRQIKQLPPHKDTKIILMTAYGQAGDAVKCRELGVEGYLTKPISQNTLVESIKRILGVSYEGEVCELNLPLVTKHLLREAIPSLRVLLAEDNDINRTVAETILEDLGHETICAVNGKIAVDQYLEQHFDLILMDIHMPEMDGFEATKNIRKIEQKTGRHIPIIALTANAIKGDRERCLAAGMDGYVSKPFERHELVDAIRLTLPLNDEKQALVTKALVSALPASTTDTTNEKEQETIVTPDKSSIDRDKILDRLGGKFSLLEKVVGMFRASYQDCLANIDDAIRANDPEALDNQAHAFKGQIGNFSTASAYQDAYQLEQMGKTKNLADAESVMASLRQNVDVLTRELQDFLEGERP